MTTDNSTDTFDNQGIDIGPDTPKPQGVGFKYPRIIRHVASTPWAMEPSRLLDVLDVLRFKACGGMLTQEEIREYCGVEAVHRGGRAREPGSAVAVIPLTGIISQHVRQVQDISGPGGTSVEGFVRDLRAAVASEEVGSVVIDIDSPGGSADGVQEAADEIMSLRGAKPIVAVANSMAASAAFWLGAAADQFSVTPSGRVGSVGVFAAHQDISEKLEAEGVKVTLVHAGEFKTEGNPFERLSEAGQEHIQGLVDEVFGKFVASVAAGRGVDTATVKRDFGQGRLVTSADALKAGMVDRIETLEQVIGRLRPISSPQGARVQADLRRRALTFT